VPEYEDRRCDQYPRYRDADTLEASIWAEVNHVLTDPDYLRHLLEEHLANESPATALSDDQQRSLRRRIDEKRRQQVTLTTEYAAAGVDADVVKAAVDDITDAIDALEEQLARAEQWDEVRSMKADAASALERLAERATETLASPSLELMKQVFDLLELRIFVVDDRLELTGTIPVGDWGDGNIPSLGEQRTGVPRHREPLRRRCDRAGDAGHGGAKCAR
jgi:hypothetical protein